MQAGRFKGETTIIDSLSLNTDLFTEVNELLAFIRKHLMVEYVITGQPSRQERFDYPEDAIREIVINMIVHRDYRSSNASIIKIYDDRITFTTPEHYMAILQLKIYYRVIMFRKPGIN